MKTFATPRFLGALAIILLVTCIVGIARAQTSPTRVTACDAATPTNAICLTWTHDGKDTTGVALGKPVTFRVQQKAGTGAYANIATAVSATQLYVKNLAPGTYFFQVYANCSPDCTESAASNVGTRDASNPVTQPNTPVLTIAVVIGQPGTTPVYRVLGKAGGYYPGEMFGLVPVGRECGAPVFKYRGAQFRRVSVQQSEVWPKTSSTANLAAPCA